MVTSTRSVDELCKFGSDFCIIGGVRPLLSLITFLLTVAGCSLVVDVDGDDGGNDDDDILLSVII